MITATEMLGGEPVVDETEARVVLYTGKTTHHDTGVHGPEECQVLLTPSRLLLFHEQMFGWWGHDYSYEQIKEVKKDGNKSVILETDGHSARLDVRSPAERDSFVAALNQRMAEAEPVPVTPEERQAAEAKVRALRRLLDAGKLTQSEYDDKAIELLGLGSSPAD
jgi:hypothetical protein